MYEADTLGKDADAALPLPSKLNQAQTNSLSPTRPFSPSRPEGPPAEQQSVVKTESSEKASPNKALVPDLPAKKDEVAAGSEAEPSIMPQKKRGRGRGRGPVRPQKFWYLLCEEYVKDKKRRSIPQYLSAKENDGWDVGPKQKGTFGRAVKMHEAGTLGKDSDAAMPLPSTLNQAQTNSLSPTRPFTPSRPVAGPPGLLPTVYLAQAAASVVPPPRPVLVPTPVTRILTYAQADEAIAALKCFGLSQGAPQIMDSCELLSHQLHGHRLQKSLENTRKSLERSKAAMLGKKRKVAAPPSTNVTSAGGRKKASSKKRKA